MTVSPEELIARLGLEKHPEGGWYRETWRAESDDDGRAAGTAIYFLLEEGQKSHWHKVDADEIWLWHAGSPIWLLQAPDGDTAPDSFRLGPNILNGEMPQQRVPAGHWQAAEVDSGWALVSCVVVPGFEFSGFEMAPEGWSPGDGDAA